jgi:hypothetical protein
MTPFDDFADQLFRLIGNAVLLNVPLGPLHADAFAHSFEQSVETAADREAVVAGTTPAAESAVAPAPVAAAQPISIATASPVVEEKKDREAGVLA